MLSEFILFQSTYTRNIRNWAYYFYHVSCDGLYTKAPAFGEVSENEIIVKFDGEFYAESSDVLVSCYWEKLKLLPKFK